jgi:hypothetical protein
MTPGLPPCAQSKGAVAPAIERPSSGMATRFVLAAFACPTPLGSPSEGDSAAPAARAPSTAAWPGERKEFLVRAPPAVGSPRLVVLTVLSYGFYGFTLFRSSCNNNQGSKTGTVLVFYFTKNRPVNQKTSNLPHRFGFPVKTDQTGFEHFL